MNYDPQTFTPTSVKQPETQTPETHQEIPDLFRHLNVAKKYWLEIILITLLTLIAVTGITLIIPKVYETQSTIQIGLVQNSPVETPQDIRVLMADEVTLQALLSAIGSADTAKNRAALKNRFNLTMIADSRLIQIKTKGNTPESAVQFNQIVVDHMTAHHHGAVQHQRDLVDKRTANIESQMKSAERDIAYLKQINDRYTADLGKINHEIQSRSQTTTDAQGRIAQTFIELAETHKDSIDQNLQTINGIEQQMTSLAFDLEIMKQSRDTENSDTAVINPTITPERPASPNITGNIIVGLLLGLFLGFIIIYTKDYFARNKKFLNR
ncbi:TPA: hypothetical protein DF272_03405 [Candidatus Falkowbacteria bacterium]|nr:hypothetical protein [Candidatus Falkowbacteria bacterium]